MDWMILLVYGFNYQLSNNNKLRILKDPLLRNSMCFFSKDSCQGTWYLYKAIVECFHSFLEFSQTLTSVSVHNSIETARKCFSLIYICRKQSKEITESHDYHWQLCCFFVVVRGLIYMCIILFSLGYFPKYCAIIKPDKSF